MTNGWRVKAARGLLVLALMLAAPELRPALAETYPSRAGSARPGGGSEDGGEGDFSEAVDPARFRKGEPLWDTQELIASGLTALHEEHQEILKALDEIRTRMSRLEGSK